MNPLGFISVVGATGVGLIHTATVLAPKIFLLLIPNSFSRSPNTCKDYTLNYIFLHENNILKEPAEK